MGTFAYGASYYGLRAYDQTAGVVHDASASASVSASIAPVNWVVNIGSGPVSTSVSSSAAASAQQFVLVLSSKFSYGTSAYGMHTYGQADLEFGTSAAASAATDGTETRVREAAAVVSATASNTASARRVPEGSALVYGTSSNTVNTTGNGARIRTGYANPAGSATGSTAQATRVRESSAAPSASVAASANSVFIVSAAAAGAATGSTNCTPRLHLSAQAPFLPHQAQLRLRIWLLILLRQQPHRLLSCLCLLRHGKAPARSAAPHRLQHLLDMFIAARLRFLQPLPLWC